MRDLDYMKIALELASRGEGSTSPNPMVGAVIVHKGRIVGRGWHRRCGGPHAEIFALRQAGPKARGAALYVTLEPCAHFGRTPPCVDAVIAGGIRRVVIGMKDPNPLTHGASIRKLRRAGIRVRTGILAPELRRMNETFVKYITQKMPFVIAKIAQTLDGKVATASGQSKWITSEKIRIFSHQLRNHVDAILVGINTVLKDDPQLDAAKTSKPLKKIVLDSRLRIGIRAKIFRHRPHDCWIATTRRASPRKITVIKRLGARVIVCPSKGKGIDLKWLLRELARHEIASVLLEGGPTVIGEALRRKVIDKFHIFLASKIMADASGRSSVVGVRCSDVNKAFKLKQVKVKNMGHDIFVTAYPDY